NLLGLAEAGTKGAIAESIMHVELEELSDAAAIAELEARLRSVLVDVRAAVEDWRPMLARFDEAREELAAQSAAAEAEEATEVPAVLQWLKDDRFTFLGARDFTIERSGDGEDQLAVIEESGLGVLRDANRQVLVAPGSMTGLAPIVRQFLDQPGLLL